MTTNQQTEARAAGVLPPVNSAALCKIVVDNCFGGRNWAAERNPIDVALDIDEDECLGSRHWAAEWALELCVEDPYFAAHMAEQPRGYAHYLCVLRLGLPSSGLWSDMDDVEPPTPTMRECARIIRTTNKKRLLKAWFPDCPPAILKALPELPKMAQSEAEYRRLIEAFKDERKRRRFFHVKRVRAFDMQLLDMMELLPERFHPGAAHCRNTADYERLCLLVECAKRLNLEIPAREFKEAAKRAKNMAGLWRYVARKALKSPFPPPPWEGDDNIRPLRSRREMKAAGRELGNCVANRSDDYALKTVTGYGYLYFCEDAPAMIEVVRDVFFGWLVSNIEGARNNSLSPADAFKIRRAFYDAGFCQATKMSFECASDALWDDILDDDDDEGDGWEDDIDDDAVDGGSLIDEL